MKQSAQPLTARLHRLNIRLDNNEWDKLYQLASRSTCRNISEYARKVLLEKPVRIFYRNQSLDDFEETMVLLLAQLETLGDNFTLLVKNANPFGLLAPLPETLVQLLDCAQTFTQTSEDIRKHVKTLADRYDTSKTDSSDINTEPCDPK